MKTIVKSFASLIVIAALVVACAPKTDNSAQTGSEAEVDSVETVVPAEEMPSDSVSMDSTSVN